MSALDRLKINEPFVNFDDVLNFVERLTTEHFMPLRITDSKTIEKYNESLKCEESYLDSNLKFHHAKFVCSHFGELLARQKLKCASKFSGILRATTLKCAQDEGKMRVKTLKCAHGMGEMRTSTLLCARSGKRDMRAKSVFTFEYARTFILVTPVRIES
jgi:hypothetical protein